MTFIGAENRSMRRTIAVACRAIAFLVAICEFAPVIGAQPVDPPRAIRSASAQHLLSSFEKRAATGSASLGTLLRQPERYEKLTIDSLVDGLEKLALSSSSSVVRSNAAWNLAIAGSARLSDRNLLNRLVRVYEQSTDELVRRSILGRMHVQQNRPAAIRFLIKVATESTSQQDYEEASLEAVSTLSYMGAEGKAALLILQRNGELRDPAARGFVEWFLREVRQP